MRVVVCPLFRSLALFILIIALPAAAQRKPAAPPAKAAPPATGTSQPLDLLAENSDYFKTYSLNYHDGEKYPHLERDTSKPDLLSDIMKAHATAR